jgi:endonuclease-3
MAIAPKDFENVWGIIKALREVRDAPVDLWGCDKVVDWSAPRDVVEFQILVAAMLSSQTKDQYVKQAMDNLRACDLSVGGALNLTEDELDDKIRMVGFHRVKAKNIQKTAKLIQSEFSGRVPSTFDALISLPGVGPKMANLVMNCAFDKSHGICVDTHVHRICNLLGWGCKSCNPRCKEPEHTREVVEQWLPREMWREFTYLLVGLGQQSQSDRRVLVRRCFNLPEPESGIKLLRRLQVNFNGIDMEDLTVPT